VISSMTAVVWTWMNWRGKLPEPPLVEVEEDEE
jgi:hypothetical protein